MGVILVTKEQALKEDIFHWGECRLIIGPKGGQRIKQDVWRRNGETKLWKKRPEEFSVPLKWGMGYNRRQYTYLTQDDAKDWHTVGECNMETVNESGHPQ